MDHKIGSLIILALVAAVTTPADTIYLKNGVRFDGVVTPVPEQEGMFRISAGDRTLIYRETEIARVEKNDKTGHLDKQALIDRWKERNQKLTEETGLTADQRRLVRGLMFELRSEDISVRIAVRDKLQALQEEADVYGYLRSLYSELSPLLAPNVLWVLVHLDTAKSIDLLEESAQSNYFETRAVALELLGQLRSQNSETLVARGLADHNQTVQINAAYALARLGVRRSTPALIGMLADPDRRVSSASRESLTALWADSLGDKRLGPVSEWEEFWNGQTAEGTPIRLEDLEPLSPEDEELTHTYDSN